MPEWTVDQEKAIYAKWRNQEKTESANILVNAAAGSGKTAVLVERIINKLCAPEGSPDRCDADSLLVVTFTNAAAKEMQQRIYDSLAKKQASAEEDKNTTEAEHLKKQLSLIHSSDITTIDAFCLKTIKSYFHLLNIDPDFKIADSAECEMLKDEAMEELFEKYYCDKEFTDLLCLFSDGRDDKELAQTIREIFDFTRSQPEPHKWLCEKAEMLLLEEEINPYFITVKKSINENAISAASIYKSALELMINEIEGNDKKRSTKELEAFIKSNPPETENDLHFSFGILYKICYNEYFLAKAIQDSTWDMCRTLLSEFKFERTNAAVKPRDKSREIKDADIIGSIKDKRIAAKKIITNNIFASLTGTRQEIKEITQKHIYPMVKSLIKFCNLFEEIYLNKKESKNLREFSDIEHLCLKLFCDFPEVTKEMQNKYTEILMDEYQDSNALQEAIFEKISRGDNLFTVGDMKQSIYRFRSSDPELFKNKCDTYSKDENAHDRKIVLSKNFRSRGEVLDGINSVFEKVMSEEVGGVLYDEEQRLYCGDDKYEEKNIGRCGENKCECYVIMSEDSSDDEEETVSSTICEARFIAKKIREMYDSKYLVRDKRKKIIITDSGEPKSVDEFYYRPVRFKDFAILMSSYKNSASVYQKELSDCGIDCYARTGGYFDRPEIKLATSLLKAINNPYNDIPLIAVLRSPIFSLSDDELCRIRIFNSGSFYDAVKSASEGCDETAEKCLRFLDKLNRWRYLAKLMPVDKLIWTLYEEASIYSFCEAVWGPDAASNLRLLFTRAKAYENSGYKGLFNFIRFIGNMKKKENDLDSAVMVGEDSDVVRLMTIHKSKGLEFPVVFLAGASKKFNISELSGKVILHKELGFGTDYIDFENSFYMQSIEKKALKIRIGQDMISEEMRKLYVALTRAKEKLIVTSVSKPSIDEEFSNPLPKKHSAWLDATGSDDKMKKSFASSADSFIDWIAPVAMRDSKNWIYTIVPYNAATQLYVPKEDFCDTASTDDKEAGAIRINSCIYSKNTNSELPVKLSVTDLKTALITDKADVLIPSPAFLSETNGLTGAQKGTAIHYVMQKFMPFAGMTEDSVAEFIAQLENKGELSKEEANAVNPKDIIDFYNTELGQRIMKSNKVVREAPFEIEIPASTVYETDGDEKILLQGIIDCYFYEGDEIVIVDYKSDFYTSIDDITQKYRIQLEYYRLAVEKICKKSVKNSFLYLFLTKSVIQC